MRAATGLVFAAVLIGGGYAAWHYTRTDPPPPAPPPAVPVTVATAKQADLPVFLRGIGTVRALNAVEIHPQVGGVLLQVPVREGQEVTKGQVLAVIDPRPYQAALDKAQAQRTQDQAQLDNGHADQKRYTTLARSDFASRQQLDTQVSTVNRLAGVVAADDAAIEEAQINLGYCVVKAPLAGRVGLRRVDPGNLIQANASGPGILSVVQDQPIAVVFTLPEDVLGHVRDAMARGPVPVLADSSDQTEQLAKGTLLTPDNTVDSASGTIQLKATFANADARLTPGQFVSVRLQSSVVSGVTVPHDAVQHGQDGLFIYTVKPDKTAERRTVKVAYDNGMQAVLAKGVPAGAEVVVAGQTRIGNGTHLAPHSEPVADASTGRPAQEAAK